MRLSVIIPCYNGANYIGVQLEALARQEWDQPWEVIVVDNGSTDNSVEIVESYGERLPGLRVVRAVERQGRGYALNAGAAEARGEALAFCDVDDEVAPGWVAAMGAALSKYALVGGALEHDKLNQPWVVEARGRAQEQEFMDCWYAPYLPFSFGSNLGIKRALHKLIGGYDVDLDIACEDMDYCWRAQEAGARLYFVPEAVVHYRLRHSFKAIFRQGYRYSQANVQLYKKFRTRGMPAVSPAWKVGLECWLQMLIRVPLVVRGKVDVARLVGRLSWQLGLVKGSIKHGIVLLGTPPVKREAEEPEATGELVA